MIDFELRSCYINTLESGPGPSYWGGLSYLVQEVFG